jgi:hypothetical protein
MIIDDILLLFFALYSFGLGLFIIHRIANGQVFPVVCQRRSMVLFKDQIVYQKQDEIITVTQSTAEVCEESHPQLQLGLVSLFIDQDWGSTNKNRIKRG